MFVFITGVRVESIPQLLIPNPLDNLGIKGQLNPLDKLLKRTTQELLKRPPAWRLEAARRQALPSVPSIGQSLHPIPA